MSKSHVTIAVVTTQLVSAPSEAAAKQWISKQKKSPKKGQTVEYQVWNHPAPLPE